MNWNPWVHVRLAGAVLLFIGSLASMTNVVIYGLLIIFIGTVCGLNRVEKMLAALVKIEEKED